MDAVNSADAGELKLPSAPSAAGNWRIISRMHQSQNFTTPLRDMRPSEHLELPKEAAEPRSAEDQEQSGSPAREIEDIGTEPG